VTASPSNRRRLPVLTAAALAVVVLLASPACARKYRAEQDGKDVGEAVCDLRDPSDEETARADLEDLNAEIDDLADSFALFTAEDRADIDENLTDLVEHTLQGNDVLIQQDITVIRRSLDNIRDDLGDTGRAAVDGILEGLDDCDNG
jgi:hypothetical protein